MEECRKYILSCHLDHQQILCLILRIRIPQRQFLGESSELSERITEKAEKEIRNILNL